MSCDEYKTLMMGYLDGELAPDQRERFETHVASCTDCEEDLAEFKRLKLELAAMKFKEPSDAELERYWRSTYNRLERGVGWVLFSIGAILALCYGGFKLVEAMVVDPDIALVLRIGVVALVFGTVVLFVSVLRERLTVRRVDKYSKEIER